jgi:hypothetical protein
MAQIAEIKLRNETREGPEGRSIFTDSIDIDENKNLHLGSFDFGPEVDKMWGHDYEYDVTISKEWKDTVLLHLAKERFKTVSEFKKWLDEKETPSETSLW